MKKIILFLSCISIFSFSVFSSNIFCQSSLYEIRAQEKCDSVYDSLKSKGFCEIGNHKFLKSDYERLYQNFDEFIALMSHDQDFAIRVYDFEKEFLSFDECKKRYCSAPPSYRDPRVHSTKRFNKIYFQFIKEHYELLKQNHPDILDNKVAHDFFQDMDRLDAMAKELFVEVIELLEQSRPGITDILYGKQKELTVISKIVRYEKTEGWGTTPHCDKSGITFIWGSDDDNDDSLVLCEDMQNPSIEKLRKPLRLFSNKENVSSTILIPGSACAKVGIDLKPTVHGVAPIQKEYRHAIISFLLIPDIDMSDIMSDFGTIVTN